MLLAVVPRAAVAAVYMVVIWSMLVDLLGSMVGALGWAEHLSLVHYMALAPAQDPDPLAVTVAAGRALCAGATVLFARRDIALA